MYIIRTKQWEVLYTEQNDMMEQSCQIDAECKALDGKIHDNEVEFGKLI